VDNAVDWQEPGVDILVPAAMRSTLRTVGFSRDNVVLREVQTSVAF